MQPMVNYYNFRFLGRFVFCVQYQFFSVKIKLSVPLLCVHALLEKAVLEMSTVSGGTLNPTIHPLTHSLMTENRF